MILLSDSRKLSRKTIIFPGNPASNGDLNLEEFGCGLNDKTEDVVIPMVEVGMMMRILILAFIMPAC